MYEYDKFDFLHAAEAATLSQRWLCIFCESISAHLEIYVVVQLAEGVRAKAGSAPLVAFITTVRATAQCCRCLLYTSPSPRD